jgi:hypothetical protein
MAERVKASFYLREPVARGLRLLAAAEGRSQSEIAEAALEAYLRDRQETFDWAKGAERAFQFWENPGDSEYDGL